MKQYTDITILLDRSGSMSSIKEAMESGFNEFLTKHKAVESTKVTLIQFDSVNPHEVVYQNVPVKAAEKLIIDARSMTPMYDAICEGIDSTGKRLASMNESDRPDQVLFVIITDGQENASKRFSQHNVKDRITHQSDRYKWQFVYLGANQDAIAEAKKYGISQDYALNFLANAGDVRSKMKSLTANSLNYTASVGSARQAKLVKFDESQRVDVNE